MPNEHILALLLAERDKLNRAIEALNGLKRRGRPPGPRTVAPEKRQRTLSAAGRKAIAEGQRKRWAAIRAGKAKRAYAAGPLSAVPGVPGPRCQSRDAV